MQKNWHVNSGLIKTLFGKPYGKNPKRGKSTMRGKLVVGISKIHLNRTMSYLICISKIQRSISKTKL